MAQRKSTKRRREQFTFRSNNDDVRFVLGIRVASLGHIITIKSKPVFADIPYGCNAA